MEKSKAERPDEFEKHQSKEQEGETRGFASSPCSLHELDAGFWPVNPEESVGENLAEQPQRDAQKSMGPMGESDLPGDLPDMDGHTGATAVWNRKHPR